MKRHEECIADGCQNKLGNHAECRGECDALQAEINRLLPKAESGEQWAHICDLESKLVTLCGR
jgi:hypothetical protein